MLASGATTVVTTVTTAAPAAAATGDAIHRSMMLTRAKTWFRDNVPYSQSATHTNEYGTYRTDCSGFVSLAWNLDSIGLTTMTLPNVSTQINKADMRPGDILNDAGSHTKMFVSWANDAHTSFRIWEMANTADDLDDEVTTLSAVTGYTAYRYDHVKASKSYPGVVRRNSSTGALDWVVDHNANANDANPGRFSFGANTDTPVPGNWFGNGRSYPAVTRATSGGALEWIVSQNVNANDTTPIRFTFGASTDIPVVGDWWGDGRAYPGLARRNHTTGAMDWILGHNALANDSNPARFSFGGVHDTPVVGNWFGTGDRTGVVRADGAGGFQWIANHNLTANDSNPLRWTFGSSAYDTPIPGDWWGTGDTYPGAVRPDGATSSLGWLQGQNVNANDTSPHRFAFGGNTDELVVAGQWW